MQDLVKFNLKSFFCFVFILLILARIKRVSCDGLWVKSYHNPLAYEPPPIV